MKGFFSWFNSRTKIKRWILLILLGVVGVTYAIACIIQEKVLRPTEIVKITKDLIFNKTMYN